MLLLSHSLLHVILLLPIITPMLLCCKTCFTTYGTGGFIGVLFWPSTRCYVSLFSFPSFFLVLLFLSWLLFHILPADSAHSSSPHPPPLLSLYPPKNTHTCLPTIFAYCNENFSVPPMSYAWWWDNFFSHTIDRIKYNMVRTPISLHVSFYFNSTEKKCRHFQNWKDFFPPEGPLPYYDPPITIAH